MTREAHSARTDRPSSAFPVPFRVLSSPYLRRTALWAGLTLGLVALNVAVYWSPRWAGAYLLSGIWALVFFALTPLIIKSMMFERRPLRGLALIGLKVFWLLLLLIVLSMGVGEAAVGRLTITAVIAGLTTPLAVVFLRALGAAWHQPADKTPQRLNPGQPNPASRVETKP